MNSELERLCGYEIRTVAREYADGQFNKEEYRNRRRDIIGRCLELNEDDTQDMPKPDAKKIVDPHRRALFWWRVAGGISIVLIGVLGYMIYSIS